MKLKKQIAAILAVITVFAAFNFVVYQLLTRRLSNNFSGATQAHMIDVKSYLPYEPDSDIPKISSSLKLEDNLPVLDGAAALVPLRTKAEAFRTITFTAKISPLTARCNTKIPCGATKLS